MERCDILIKGGTIIDGSGATGYQGDLAINGDKISAIGDCGAWQSEQTIDAAGKVVAPGFIDVHTHDDVAVLNTPEMPFKITQGVTTIIGGNCGLSAAPIVGDGPLPDPFNLLFTEPKTRFPDLAAYQKAFDAANPAVNVAMLVGHSALRIAAMGLELDRVATDSEIAEMGDLLEMLMAQGAIGLSSGLAYPTAIAAPIDEVVPIAARMKGYRNAIYTSHMRDESDGVMEAVQETLETGQRAGTRVVISHHKCSGKRNFGRSEETLAEIEKAQLRGDVGLDVYPYAASSTSLYL